MRDEEPEWDHRALRDIRLMICKMHFMRLTCVYNPVFRFASRFMVRHPAMLDAYLKGIGEAVSQEVQIEN